MGGFQELSFLSLTTTTKRAVLESSLHNVMQSHIPVLRQRPAWQNSVDTIRSDSHNAMLTLAGT